MSKYAIVFCDSFYPLQIFGTYKCLSQSTDQCNELIFTKLGSCSNLILSNDGSIIFEDKDVHTLIAKTDYSFDSQWFITFDYFGEHVTIARFDESIKIAIGCYINPILSRSTSHVFDESR